MRVVQEQAFGISTAISSTLQMVVLVWLLRRKLGGRMGATAIAGSVVRTFAATAACGAVTWFALEWTQTLDLTAWGRMGSRAVHVFGPLAAGMVVFVLMTRVLRMPELGWLLKRERGESTRT